MHTQYSFISRWQIKAPLHEVWNAIYESSEWPNWWPGVKAVSILNKGAENGIGGVRRYTWQSVLPYKLSFNMQLTEREDLELLKGIAFGELEGEGTWLFKAENNITYIQYNWNVYTTKPWMNYWAFLLKPVFTFNHNIVMRRGAKGLAKKLNAALIKCQ